MTGESLAERLRDLLTAVRAFKARTMPQSSPVPPGTLGVLALIASGRGTHVTSIATESLLDPSTVSRAVATLVKAGLVERNADPDDGRASVLAVTGSGRAALDEVLTHHHRQLAGALREWTPEELDALSTMLQRFTHDLMEAAR